MVSEVGGSETLDKVARLLGRQTGLSGVGILGAKE